MNRYIEWQKHPPTHEPSPAETFFTETVPDWFTVDIPHGFAPVVEFTTADIPTFFTQTVPKGFEEIGQRMKEAGTRLLWIILGLIAGYFILKEGIHAIFE